MTEERLLAEAMSKVFANEINEIRDAAKGDEWAYVTGLIQLGYLKGHQAGFIRGGMHVADESLQAVYRHRIGRQSVFEDPELHVLTDEELEKVEEEAYEKGRESVFEEFHVLTDEELEKIEAEAYEKGRESVFEDPELHVLTDEELEKMEGREDER